MAERITILKPDDWHLHVRDGAMLKAVTAHTAPVFGRAILMPNLAPPVLTAKDAAAYRARVMAALPEGSAFQPLMTCCLTDVTSPDDIEAGFRAGVLTAVKMYPANATTNSAHGVTDFGKIRPALARMEKIGMPFLIHGEEADPDIDIFDREAVFIERRLIPMMRDFPRLKLVLEHLTTKVAVDFVRDAGPQIAGTITPHHLQFTRNDLLAFGLRPNLYCMPVVKRREDREALRKAATSGAACYFLGTDSAPHPLGRKIATVCAAGIFNAPVAMETYAEVFAEEKALDKLEAFASLNGPKHYGFPANASTIVLERVSWTVPLDVAVDGSEDRILVHRGGETLQWKVVAV
jgi:dihydroorotase